MSWITYTPATVAAMYTRAFPGWLQGTIISAGQVLLCTLSDEAHGYALIDHTTFVVTKETYYDVLPEAQAWLERRAREER